MGPYAVIFRTSSNAILGSPTSHFSEYNYLFFMDLLHEYDVRYKFTLFNI